MGELSEPHEIIGSAMILHLDPAAQIYETILNVKIYLGPLAKSGNQGCSLLGVELLGSCSNWVVFS